MAHSWKSYWIVLKVSLLVLIFSWVIYLAWGMFQKLDLTKVPFHPVWLLAAGGVYLVGWIPSILYWNHLLAGFGLRQSNLTMTRAYFCGHLGKYIPGKAAVLVIRATILTPFGVPASIGAMTAAFETLVTVVAGLLAGSMMIPWLFSKDQWISWIGPSLATAAPILVPMFTTVGCLLGLPIMAKVINRLIRKFHSQSESPQISIDWRHFGFLVFSWWIQGLSLGFTIQAISDEALSVADWPRWTAGTSLAFSLGFITLISPGGAGISEAILYAIFHAEYGEKALLIALLLRMVWMAAEILAAGFFTLLERAIPFFGSGKTRDQNSNIMPVTKHPDRM